MLYLVLPSDFSKSENIKQAWRCPTLTWGNPTLPSALFRFTSEFGMEIRWVQNAMVAKQILVKPAYWASLIIWKAAFSSIKSYSRYYTFNVLTLSPGYPKSKPLGCCMVKPHGQLVQVSSTPHNAYTPCLSTS